VQNLIILQERCSDTALSVRKQALQSLTDLLHSLPLNILIQRCSYLDTDETCLWPLKCRPSSLCRLVVAVGWIATWTGNVRAKYTHEFIVVLAARGWIKINAVLKIIQCVFLLCSIWFYLVFMLLVYLCISRLI